MTHEEVRKLAQLARLDLNEAEAAKAQNELERVLEYVGRLSKIETKGVPETEPADVEAAWRADEARTPDPTVRAAIIKNFPDASGDLLRTPAVFEKPKG